jgi:predicted O-linked N-acetylglucosamine transferase (SPINDLY family)
MVSGFFCAHSNWKIPISGWLAGLDRTRFEVMGYYTGVRQDACTDEAKALCDRFVQGPLSPDAWRTRIVEDAPHALIYPEIGMDPTAAQLAAQRLAPLQCASWGHPDTSGMPTIDAYLSSDLMEPENGQDHYAEQLVRLPGLGVRLAPPAEAPEPLDRETLGYRPDAVVFWCAQSLPKYLPRFDDIYPRIALEVPGCQFVFIGMPQRCEAERLFMARLEAAFARHGLDAADHVVMLPRMSKAQFMGAIAEADIVLDSLGWSGCNSILESLGADLPVVTHAGDLMRGRHAAAILQTMGVEDTIAASVDDYVDLAVTLARDPDRRTRIGARMAAGRNRLYADDGGVRALESFLERTLRAV